MKTAYLAISSKHKTIGQVNLELSEACQYLEKKGYKVIYYHLAREEFKIKHTKHSSVWHLGKKIQALSLCDIAVFLGDDKFLEKRIAIHYNIPCFTNLNDI